MSDKNAPDRFVPNFGEQGRGISDVLLPLGHPDAIERIMRDLVAFGFGMGQAPPESAELLKWFDKSKEAQARLRKHIAAIRVPGEKGEKP